MTEEKSPRRTPEQDELEKERDERIRKRAYDLWLVEGQPQGRELDHWFRAQQEIARSAEELILAEGQMTTLNDSD